MQTKPISAFSRPDENQEQFNQFIEELQEGNVLLMVGKAFEAEATVFKNDFYDFVQSEINRMCGTENLDFSELDKDNRFLMDPQNPRYERSIHTEIAKVVDSHTYSAEEDVSGLLMALIRTGLFPFVFTTSFSPLVEIAMREQFGMVRVMNLFDSRNRDIIGEKDFRIPTVYYLFGKAALPSDGQSMKRFVATDNDALEALRTWQTKMSGTALLQYASQKYILTLGCTQDDWLFRFIWYTMKGGLHYLSKGLVANYAESNSLSNYLRLNHVLINNDAPELVKKILNAIENGNQSRFDMPRIGCDVFISYSRKDRKIADILYDSLTKKGLSVWYDKYDLAGSQGGKFMDRICEAVETSEIFVAILTESISEQASGIHVYRKEWEWARSKKLGLSAIERCRAVFPSGYDIYGKKYVDGVEWLSELDNYVFDKEAPDFGQFADSIRNIINKIRLNG